MKMKTFLAASAIAALSAGAAAAATFNIGAATPAGVNDFDADLAAFYGGAGNVGFGTLLGVDANAGVGEVFTFRGFGSESGYTNSLAFQGSAPGTISEVTANDPWGTGEGPLSSIFTGTLAAGDLKFTSSGASDAMMGDVRFGIYYDLTGTISTVFLAFDDQDDGEVDDNHDDLIVRLDTAVVPLPASALLLLGGVGGLAALRRRKKA